jgi:hypothetical protein
MKFKLTIELGDDAMQTGRDVASALRDVAEKLAMIDGELKGADSYDKAGRISDINGNIVGNWKVAR